MNRYWLAILASALWAGGLQCAEAPPAEGRAILAELIAINTTDSSGDNTRAARAVAERMRAAGYAAEDVQVVEPVPRKGNVVIRLRGTGAARPILFLAHLDVVEARRADWSMDPFLLAEKDGYFYGRGTLDCKGDAAVLVETFLRLKREGFRPRRDLILALTADEEGGKANGVEWLLGNRRASIDAAFCVNNDGGGGQMKHGKPVLYAIQAAEKAYASFHLVAKNRGGHSSLPVPDNAIYAAAEALERLRKVQFPVNLNPVTRGYFGGQAAVDPENGADLRAI
ncbi:MAG: M20/M25/M40 family metallo-hydrolase, partial [Acidobacteria bacterium]|nr:M20/M25/M40 family metallo-hydrolase [Acidobacteriota bacterium]